MSTCTPDSTISAEQLLERLQWRYATKNFDTTRKISESDITALEDALVLTASSGGLQPWRFLIITDSALRQKLRAVSNNQAQVTDASHLVVFAAKKNLTEADVDAHIENTAKIRGTTPDSLAAFRKMMVDGLVKSMDQQAHTAWAGRQATIALGNLLTCAALLGIDACPMEGFDPKQYDTILGLDKEGYTSIAICPLGYRSEEDKYAKLPKVRFPKEKVLRRI